MSNHNICLHGEIRKKTSSCKKTKTTTTTTTKKKKKKKKSGAMVSGILSCWAIIMDPKSFIIIQMKKISLFYLQKKQTILVLGGKSTHTSETQYYSYVVRSGINTCVGCGKMGLSGLSMIITLVLSVLGSSFCLPLHQDAKHIFMLVRPPFFYFQV